MERRGPPPLSPIHAVMSCALLVLVLVLSACQPKGVTATTTVTASTPTAGTGTSPSRSRALAEAMIDVDPSASAAAIATGHFSGEHIDLPDVTVIASDGQTARFRSDIAAGNLLVVTFNYTTCESICPVGNVVMQALDRDAAARLKRPLRLLSITIDPGHDTPVRMRRAAAELGASPQWLWLTGQAAEMDLLLARFGAKPIDILTHDPIFLVGDSRTGRFIRLSGLPEPDQVLRHLADLDS